MYSAKLRICQKRITVFLEKECKTKKKQWKPGIVFKSLKQMYVSQLLEGKGEMTLIGKSGQQRQESSTWEILNPSVFLLAAMLHL